MPPFTSKARLYQVLWLEGLAAYMSEALNPSSSDEQVFLSSTVASDFAVTGNGWQQIYSSTSTRQENRQSTPTCSTQTGPAKSPDAPVAKSAL